MNERASLAERVGVTTLLFLEKRLEQRIESFLIPIGVAGIGLASIILARPYLENLFTDQADSYFDQLSAVTPSLAYSLEGNWNQNPGLINTLESFPKNNDLRLLPQQGFDIKSFGNLYFQQSSKSAFIAIDGRQLRSLLGDTNYNNLNIPVGFFFLDHQTPRDAISIQEHFDIYLDEWLRNLREADYQKARETLSIKFSASIRAGIETVAKYGSGSSRLAIYPGNLINENFEAKRNFYEKQFAKDNRRLIARVLAFDPKLLPH